MCRTDIVKIAILSKLTYSFKTISTEMPHRIQDKNHRIHVESEETQNSKSKSREEEQSRKYHTTRFQDILQSNSVKNSMTLAQRWKHDL